MLQAVANTGKARSLAPAQTEQIGTITFFTTTTNEKLEVPVYTQFWSARRNYPFAYERESYLKSQGYTNIGQSYYQKKD